MFRRSLLTLLLVPAMLSATSARAQCQPVAGQDGGANGCPPMFSLSVAPLPATTTAPVLEIDTVIQDTGAQLVRSPSAQIFVTVSGSGAGGGGVLVLPDGGTDETTYANRPFVAPLAVTGYSSDAGTFTSAWEGKPSLFAGSNSVVVSAIEPSGTRLDSVPQIVFLDVSSGGSADGGSGGSADGGSGGSADGGSGGGADGGSSGGSDGGTVGPDGGVIYAQAGLRASSLSDESTQGCSTTAGGPPSFLLMALAVMGIGLGRRAMGG